MNDEVREGSAGGAAVFDPAARNVKLTIEYEGTAYFGWQWQEGQVSVQEMVERAASRVVDHPVTIYGSGRTDRGVHALGQVANFRTSRTIPTGKLLLGINTYLPDDIRVRAVEDVSPEFHARYSARGKRYRYTFLRGSVESVLVRRFCSLAPIPLDLDAMRRAAEAIPGMRDFRALEGAAKRRPPAPGEAPRSTVRTVMGVVVREAGPFIAIDAFGRGFLYGMVRTIAGTLHEVGAGRRTPGSIEEMLASGDRRRAGFNAPARGLCLLDVYYDDSAAEEALRAAREDRDAPGLPPAGHLQFLKMFY